ncbi:MAG: glycosyltransferase [Candidatus Binatus sp.]|uniref:glycosyltransferase n=1 Tax=Candidatus Binatus sp. TaxID=2811406 RepID=UPI003D0DFB53
MTGLFYISGFLLLYAYVLYPIVLIALSRSQPRRAGSDDERVGSTAAPSLSVIVAAYNEERCIAHKIENFLSCQYAGEAEMIVVSDGSSDRTAEIAESMAGERVRVIRQPQRRGKGVAVNEGANAARGEVLVFTDANAMFAADALEKVARPMRDKSIGLVTGVSRYPGQTIGSTHQRYEQMLKGLESRLGVVAGADGALYALRRDLFKPLDPALINDFVHPIVASLAGAQSVMAGDAFALEEFSEAGEFARQVRMVSQAALVYFRLLPELIKKRRWRSILVLTSHKMLRWLTAPLLVIAVIATVPLAGRGGTFRVVLGMEILFGLIAAIGMVASRRGTEGKATIAYQFVALNCAQAVGLWRCFSGEVPVVWKPRNL